MNKTVATSFKYSFTLKTNFYQYISIILKQANIFLFKSSMDLIRTLGTIS